MTTILYPFSGLQDINPAIVENAGNRGTRVHKICESIAAGLGEFGVTDETWGYVESFKKWWSAGHKIVEMEKRFFDDTLEITGQVDFIIDYDGSLSVVDLKTSSKPSKTWIAQGQAYAMLAKASGYDIKSIKFIHLNKHGKMAKTHEYPVESDLFMSCYTVYKHFFHKETVDEETSEFAASAA